MKTSPTPYNSPRLLIELKDGEGLPVILIWLMQSQLSLCIKINKNNPPNFTIPKEKHIRHMIFLFFFWHPTSRVFVFLAKRKPKAPIQEISNLQRGVHWDLVPFNFSWILKLTAISPLKIGCPQRKGSSFSTINFQVRAVRNSICPYWIGSEVTHLEHSVHLSRRMIRAPVAAQL